MKDRFLIDFVWYKNPFNSIAWMPLFGESVDASRSLTDRAYVLIREVYPPNRWCGNLFGLTLNCNKSQITY